MPLRLLLQLSVRNILRHGRRNGMMLVAILVAVASVVLMNSLIRGMQQDMADAAVDKLVGHVKVLAPGYRDDPSAQRSFALPTGWRLPAKLGLAADWAARLRAPAVVMSERGARGIQLVGIDPAREDISFLADVQVAGEFLSDRADRRILVGRALAEQLETDLGRRMVIIAQGADGRSREAGFRIAGLYDADGEGLEKALVFTGLTALQERLGAEAVTELSVRLDGGSPPATRLRQLKEALAAAFPGLETWDWQALQPQAAAMFAYVDAAIFIWFLVMMGALAFGLVNTLITSVMERVRELGLLRTLGLKARSVVAQVVLESCILMLIGVAAGVLLGWLLVQALADGIDLSLWADGVESFGMRALLRPVASAQDIALVVVLSLALGALASLYPAWRVVRIKPLQALGR